MRTPIPKIRFLGLIDGNMEDGYTFLLRLATGKPLTVQVELSIDPDNIEQPMPLPKYGMWWFYKRKVFLVDPAPPETQLEPADLNELQLRIKHAAIRQEKDLKRVQREVEAFENNERLPLARRERIPDSVRLFVWQRDHGACVRCGSNQKLEFDHIIPVAEGGANTERNIQLLCETCNRQKGKRI